MSEPEHEMMDLSQRADAQPIMVAALYRFAPWPDFSDARAPLQALCDELGVRGTLLIASEGVNGTIAGRQGPLDQVIAWLRGHPGFDRLDVKWSQAADMPFIRMKVRLKREIVTMGVADIDPTTVVGTYVKPRDWNALISDPDMTVIDTRNAYEVEIGTFRGAIDPGTDAFSEFPNWVAENLDPAKQRRVAMFCTGGIRCEKATALLKSRGFEEVYHLEGGILRYLEEVAVDQSLWDGSCFVFDRRVSVDHGLVQGPHQLCSICREPIETGQTVGGYASHDCAQCVARGDADQLTSAADRRRQIAIAEGRGLSHLGPDATAHATTSRQPHRSVKMGADRTDPSCERTT